MGIHKKSLTEQDFMRAQWWVARYSEELDFDPSLHTEFMTTYLHVRAIERVADALNNVALAISEGKKPEKEVINKRSQYSEAIPRTR